MRLLLTTTTLMSLLARSSAFTFTTTRILARSSRPIAATISAAFFPHHVSSLSSSSSFSKNKRNLSQMAKKDDEESFTTWSFDKYCETMDWNTLHPAEIGIADDTALEESDLLIVGVYAPAKEDEDEEEEEDDDDDKEKEVEVTLEGKAKELDDKLGGLLSQVMKENAKTFKNGATVGATTPTVRAVVKGEDGTSKTKRYIVIGMGKANPKEDESQNLLSKIGSTIGTQCNSEKGIESCTVLLPNINTSLSDLSSAFYAALYSDNRYRTKDKIKKSAEEMTQLNIVLENSSVDGDAEAQLQQGKHFATGIALAKDIVNAPHNILNSVSLANTAKQIAEESPDGLMKCTILDKDECEKRGMGGYLGVARGSETEPQFIHLVYKPKSGDIKKKIAVIGKGMTFDTGGYNIKTQMMELMKFDCGGSAAVLGAARAVAALAPEGVEAHFIVPACENMISERAYVPGDILTASNGKTIEVINTDAEGRLTLADALVYADKELKCEKIIELSTLTGACMISLGQDYAGIWTSNDDLAKELDQISKDTGDKSWRMPLIKEYNEQLDSKIADMTNCGTRYGGAITAALFLQNFVGKKVPFAHIDIAGPVWSDKVGATGFGAKLVTEWVVRQGKEE